MEAAAFARGGTMTEAKQPPEDEKVACEICLKEIPVSEATSAEATDYVIHFCGLECYGKWKEQGSDEKS
jgi:hypothetical protein